MALAIVIFGITFASLVFGELVPKRFAVQRPERVAMRVARPLQRLSRLMKPFVLRLLSLSQPRDEAPTQQEISGMLKEGTDTGVLDKAEYAIVRRALRLGGQRLSALMTPRIDLHFNDLNDDVQHNLVKIASSPYSRFPVWNVERSQVLGMVHAGRDRYRGGGQARPVCACHGHRHGPRGTVPPASGGAGAGH